MEQEERKGEKMIKGIEMYYVQVPIPHKECKHEPYVLIKNSNLKSKSGSKLNLLITDVFLLRKSFPPPYIYTENSS